jgi:hypothetical protein
MAKLSGKAAAIKYERSGFIRRQFARQLIKLGVRNTDRGRNVTLVELGFFGPLIHKNGQVVLVLLGDIFN